MIEFTAVGGEFAERIVESPRQWRAVSGAPVADHEGEFEYDLGGAYPVDRLDVTLAEPNSVVPAQIFARANAAEPWQPVESTVFYRLREPGGEVASAPVPVAGARATILAAPVRSAIGRVRSLRAAASRRMAAGGAHIRDARPAALHARLRQSPRHAGRAADFDARARIRCGEGTSCRHQCRIGRPFGRAGRQGPPARAAGRQTLDPLGEPRAWRDSAGMDGMAAVARDGRCARIGEGGHAPDCTSLVRRSPIRSTRPRRARAARHPRGRAARGPRARSTAWSRC